MKQNLKHITGIMLLIATIVICSFSPFGDGKSLQYVANFFSLFILVPGAVALLADKMNPELFKK